MPETVPPRPENTTGIALFDPVLCACCLQWSTVENTAVMDDGRVLCVYCQPCGGCGSYDCPDIDGPCMADLRA